MTAARKTFLLAVALLALGGAMTTACQRQPEPAGRSEQSARYHCPMHPTYVSDKPGDCPICGMRLVPLEDKAAAAPAATGERKVAYYRSPMDPSVRSDVPAKDSMGMDFVPVYEDELAGAGAVPGRATVTLSAERRQVLGLRSEPVRVGSLARPIRTVGRVAPDERRLHHVHTKFEGYVEKLYVDFVGKKVRKGEPLASIYSPELVATQEEYLLAMRAEERLSGAEVPSVVKGGQDLVAAARRRLLLWDIRAEDVDALERSGTVRRTLDLYAEVEGYVVGKTALQGMRVMPSDPLFDIADLSHLWVLADVYEADLPAVRLGMQAELSIAYIPERKWRGTVTWIAPAVEEKTRTVKVRVEVDNRDDRLKPEMFADVVLEAGVGRGLIVPETALVRSGTRTLVFVDREGGVLEPREVQVGGRTESGVHVRSGLGEGDRVVVSANFLLDSESSLRAALAQMAAPAAHAGH
jgi:multidrug efflux pump subunit AcrA (membrane-fusion protein)